MGVLPPGTGSGSAVFIEGNPLGRWGGWEGGMAHSRTSYCAFLMRPNSPLPSKKNGFYPNVALDSRLSLGSPNRALEARRTGGEGGIQQESESQASGQPQAGAGALGLLWPFLPPATFPHWLLQPWLP